MAVSPSDLRLGARFDADRAVILTRAINHACANIEKMPVRYITYPGSGDRLLFESEFSRVRATGRPIVLSRQYLGAARGCVPTRRRISERDKGTERKQGGDCVRAFLLGDSN